MLKTTSRGQQQFAKKPGTPGKSMAELAKELREPEGWRSVNEKLKALAVIKADLEKRLESLKPSYRRYAAINKQLATVNKEIDNLMLTLRTAVNRNRWEE
ncbi:MAG: hypothetical protein K6U04_13100 [Armatimonadetes bacterium]|nr:hypothetical protein [Armatimonadota bacterium]